MVNRTFNLGQLDFSVQCEGATECFHYWCSRPGQWYMVMRPLVGSFDRNKLWLNRGGFGDGCVSCGATYLLLNVSRTTNTTTGQQGVPAWGDQCGPGRVYCAWAAQLMVDQTSYNSIFFTSRTGSAAQLDYPTNIDSICYPSTPLPISGTTPAPTGAPTVATPHSQATTLKPWWKFW